MGITGLLPCLKPHMKPKHLSTLKGKTVGVDSYSWLHKAVYSCAIELCEEQNQEDGETQYKPRPGSCTKWISYVLNLIDMLLFHEVNILMVFDGADLLAKAQTEASRAASRRSKLAQAKEHAQAGRHKDAYNCYNGAVDVNPWMAARLIHVLKTARPQVRTLVAPYEADAQLSALCALGMLDAVIGEDSDMVPYGVPELVLKLDAKNGDFTSLELADIYSKPTSGFDMRAFDPTMTVTMCVTAGCDYLPSVKGVGIRKAHSLVAVQKSSPKVLRSLRMDGLIPLAFCSSREFASGALSDLGGTAEASASASASANTSPAESAAETAVGKKTTVLQYELAFHRACATFRHQVVYDPVLCIARPLQPIVHADLPPCLQALISAAAAEAAVTSTSVELAQHFPFLGAIMPQATAQGIAEGLLHPTTHQAFNVDWDELDRPSARLANTSDYGRGGGGGGGGGGGDPSKWSPKSRGRMKGGHKSKLAAMRDQAQPAITMAFSATAAGRGGGERYGAGGSVGSGTAGASSSAGSKNVSPLRSYRPSSFAASYASAGAAANAAAAEDIPDVSLIDAPPASRPVSSSSFFGGRNRQKVYVVPVGQSLQALSEAKRVRAKEQLAAYELNERQHDIDSADADSGTGAGVGSAPEPEPEPHHVVWTEAGYGGMSLSPPVRRYSAMAGSGGNQAQGRSCRGDSPPREAGAAAAGGGGEREASGGGLGRGLDYLLHKFAYVPPAGAAATNEPCSLPLAAGTVPPHFMGTGTGSWNGGGGGVMPMQSKFSSSSTRQMALKRKLDAFEYSVHSELDAASEGAAEDGQEWMAGAGGGAGSFSFGDFACPG